MYIYPATFRSTIRDQSYFLTLKQRVPQFYRSVRRILLKRSLRLHDRFTITETRLMFSRLLGSISRYLSGPTMSAVTKGKTYRRTRLFVSAVFPR